MDDLDAVLARLDRSMHDEVCAVHSNGSARRAKVAGDDLDERRLARPVVAHQPHDLAAFEGASSGVLGEQDYDEAGAALEPGTSAAILVYENTWAAPFATALRKNGAQLVANGRIPVNALMQKLDELEAEQGQ